MGCRPIPVICQKADARRAIIFDWTEYCSNRWTASEVRGLNETVRPTEANGYQYVYSTEGQSGSEEPEWPTTPGETVLDGSAELTCELIDNDSLTRTISSSTWDAPAALTVDGESYQVADGEQKTWAFVEGLTVGTYRVRNTVTFSDGTEDIGEADIEIE